MISLVSRTGTPIATVQYSDLAGATHSHAKDPKWDQALAGPPPNLDVPGGVFRSTKHWLALQSKSHYFVLRLEDGNWKHVVETLEARSGIRVALVSRWSSCSCCVTKNWVSRKSIGSNRDGDRRPVTELRSDPE